MQAVSIRRKKFRPTVFGVVNTALLVLFAVLCLFPFLNQVFVSFASPEDYYRANLLVFPNHFNFESYKYIFYQDRVLYAFGISMLTTVGGTAFNMTLTILGAYALTKKAMPGHKIFFIFILITMFFSGGLIPFYITVRSLGLMNNLLGIIIPFGINTFNMIILRNFFSQVPDSIVESCKMDGANEFIVLLRFVLPLSMAGIATVSLFYLVERWNDWYWPMLFITDSDWFPLALELRNLLSQNQSTGIGGGGSIDPGLMFSEGQQAATIVIAIIPILCVYPFIQRYFVKGVMIGAIKS